MAQFILQNTIKFPSQGGLDPKDIPKDPSRWKGHLLKSIQDYFNVNNVLVLQHNYIFDPYSAFLSSEPVIDGKVSGLLRNKPAQLSERYETIMGGLSEPLEDYDRQELYLEWFQKVDNFIQTHTSWNPKDVKWYYYLDFLESLRPIQQLKSSTPEAYYGDVFCKFCQYLFDPHLMGVTASPCKIDYSVDFQSQGVNLMLTARPDFHIIMKQSHVPLLTGKVKGMRDNSVVDRPSSPGSAGEEAPVERSAQTLTPKEVIEPRESVQESDFHRNADGETEDIETLFGDMKESSAIYREITIKEKSSIGSVITQLVGELLVLFRHGERVFLHEKFYRNKAVRYGVAITGYKVMFVTVGLVDQTKRLGRPPMLEDLVLQRSNVTLEGAVPRNAIRTDVFVTRQFDLLSTADRICVADILFALASGIMSSR